VPRVLQHFMFPGTDLDAFDARHARTIPNVYPTLGGASSIADRSSLGTPPTGSSHAAGAGAGTGYETKSGDVDPRVGSAEDRLLCKRDVTVLAPDLRVPSMHTLLRILASLQEHAISVPAEFVQLCRDANKFGRLAALIDSGVITVEIADMTTLRSLMTSMSDHMQAIHDVLREQGRVASTLHVEDLRMNLYDFTLEVLTVVDERR
jgi:hypothetical protein